MAGSEDATHQAKRRRRWLTGGSRWALGVAVVALAGLLVLWFQRKPIADNYVQRVLRARNVAARYDIADLGFSRQRLTHLIIGDPRHPDLVADWVEVATSLGLSGVQVTGIRAGHVRMRGQIANGRLMLGAIDRLLPPTDGKPFTLPALNLDIADGRMRLETAQGLVGIKLSGRGPLANGFAGHAGVVSPRLVAGGCAADQIAATLAIKITDRQPSVSGPIRVAEIRCGTTRLKGAQATIDAILDERLDRWRGKAALAVVSVKHPRVRLGALAGSVDFDGSPRRTAGNLDLQTATIQSAMGQSQQGRVAGTYRIGTAGLGFSGTASAQGAAIAPRLSASLGRYANAARGTPVASLWGKLIKAAQQAARRFSLSADIAIDQAGNSTRLALARTTLQSASGSTISLSGGDGIEIDQRGVRLNGVLALVGGGLPEAAIEVHQSAPGAPVIGSALVRPYAAGRDRLALTAVDFTASPSGATRISTRATVSGPLGTGRVEAASLPIEAYWNGHGRLRVNPGCAPLSFERLAISGLALGKTRLGLCASRQALVSIDGGTLGGGGTIKAPVLVGTLGSARLSVAADEVHFGLARQDFGASAVRARLGAPERESMLDVMSVSGQIDDGGATGLFSGGAGHIAKVPLLLSGGAGNWQLSGGKLGIAGQLTVADADPEPRFYPLISRDIAFTLENNAIRATGTLTTPTTNALVSNVTLVHDLEKSTGSADLVVPSLVFGPALRPDQLTRFTFGVIADVVGTVTGNGHIGWTPDGVTSNGAFRTSNTNLAAAFGPVTELSGEIRFTDLLNLESAPGQVATIASVNPGIPVLDGTVRYQTLSGARIAVEGARWPFAGGELILEPSVLDFSAPSDRRLTFRVVGVDAAQFLQQFDFKNLDATGTFDGALPMIFDSTGGRIEGGHLTVRESGGTIAYVGEVSQKDLGFWANMAFDALKSLRYKSLYIDMNGPLAGEMFTEVRFAGISQGEGTKSNFLIRRLQKLPLVFNVRIAAPFRQLIDSVQSYYDPKRLIDRNRAELIRAEAESIDPQAQPRSQPPPKADKPVQPPASEPMP